MTNFLHENFHFNVCFQEPVQDISANYYGIIGEGLSGQPWPFGEAEIVPGIEEKMRTLGKGW